MRIHFCEMDFDAWGHYLASSYTSEAPTMCPVKPTMRATAVRVAVIAALGVGCASPGRPSGQAGTAGGVGAAGAAAGGATGSSTGVGGDALGTGGAATGTGVAGAGDQTGSGGDPGSVPGTVPSGAGGTVDQGRLFTDAATVSPSTDAGAASTPEAPPADAGGKSVPGDGNTSTCHVGGMSFLLVFTQKGTDVTMVATATNCPAGNHTIQIHGGFSCDNAGTEGGVWDGKRGDGIPTLSCANNKGSLTYTRSGADPTTSWTVGDHATKTDVTLHPMSVDTSCGTFF
jgi:hypothetical protein